MVPLFTNGAHFFVSRMVFEMDVLLRISDSCVILKYKVVWKRG